MFFAIVFVCTRISQITTLLCVVGMLAWFIDIFVKHNLLTPNSILILFIVSVLALAWAVFTLFSYHRSSANAFFVALIDIAIVGALIAGIYYLRGIRLADCTDPSPDTVWTDFMGRDITSYGFTWQVTKPCAMLKASWAFAIMNTVFFATTSLAAWSHGDHFSAADERRYRKRNHHSSRHNNRRSSRSRSGGSHYSRHSNHSHRVYV